MIARRSHETCACRRHIVSLPLGFLPPRVTDLADVGLHIFNHFFLESHSRLVPFSLFLSLSRYPFFERTCLSGLFIVSLSLFLSPLSSFPELPGNVCAFHPEKWIFSFGKKSEKSAYSLHAARGCASGPRANEAVPNVGFVARRERRGRVTKGEREEN